MKNSYRIAEISFGYSHWDSKYEFEFDGHHFEVHRIGANYSASLVKQLIQKLRTDVDAFALVSLPPVPVFGNKTYIHRQYFDIMNTPSSVPLCDGTGLWEILTLKELIKKIDIQEIDPKGGFFFASALCNSEVEEYLRHLPGTKVSFGDLYSILGVPLTIRPFPGLMTLAKMGINIAAVKDIKNQSGSSEQPFHGMGKEFLRNQISNYRYIVGDLSLFSYLGENADIINNKDVIISSHHRNLEKHLKSFKPNSIINLFPEEYKLSSDVNFSVLEAAIRLSRNKAAGLTFEEWQETLAIPTEIMPIVRRYAMKRHDSTQLKVSKSLHKIKNKIQNEKAPDFAFVVHALSHRDLERVPLLGGALKMLPRSWNDNVDRGIAQLPPILYGRVNHVVSESSGKEVNGIIYALWSTPKVLKSQSAETTYEQIQKCCEDAAARGAKIIGLGAYTKVVGDSGVTINKNSPLPVTTGNSLSASATLWGLHDVVIKMNLLSRDSNTNLVNGTAMVIGATGSIGKVSAKLLALTFKKLIIVAPKLERLEELKLELLEINPKCEVICSAHSNDFADQVDALVTATSAFDQKIVDVMKLKPGCVVCDCSRPLDFTKEDAQKRPDIIIMESGELILPGPYDLTCDLGLPGKTVYACLAETALLALEERYESFTLGRDIDFQKVKEIYKLSRKHGLKLSHIQGHMGTITDREIQLTRELALSKLKNR